jgi:hypothetical protein
MMSEGLWCFGTTLANAVNIETLTGGNAPHIFDGGLVPLIAPVKSMTGSGGARFDGFINASLRFDYLTKAEFNALIVGVFGLWTVGSVERYLIAKDESECFSPFLAHIIRPQPRTTDGQGDYEKIDYGDVQNLEISLHRCRLQSVTKAANATLTASERLAYTDSTSGDITITLPLAAAVAANTPVRVEKFATANTVSVQKQGSDTFSTATLTALGESLTVVSNGVSRWTTWTD